MKRVLEGPVVVLPRGDVVDVFTGKGWTTHSVFQIVRGFPRYVSGAPLTEEDFKILKGLT